MVFEKFAVVASSVERFEPAVGRFELICYVGRDGGTGGRLAKRANGEHDLKRSEKKVSDIDEKHLRQRERGAPDSRT
jgi:hypothetical protein